MKPYPTFFIRAVILTLTVTICTKIVHGSTPTIAPGTTEQKTAAISTLPSTAIRIPPDMERITARSESVIVSTYPEVAREHLKLRRVNYAYAMDKYSGSIEEWFRISVAYTVPPEPASANGKGEQKQGPSIKFDDKQTFTTFIIVMGGDGVAKNIRYNGSRPPGANENEGIVNFTAGGNLDYLQPFNNSIKPDLATIERLARQQLASTFPDISGNELGMRTLNFEQEAGGFGTGTFSVELWHAPNTHYALSNDVEVLNYRSFELTLDDTGSVMFMGTPKKHYLKKTTEIEYGWTQREGKTRGRLAGVPDDYVPYADRNDNQEPALFTADKKNPGVGDVYMSIHYSDVSIQDIATLYANVIDNDVYLIPPSTPPKFTIIFEDEMTYSDLAKIIESLLRASGMKIQVAKSKPVVISGAEQASPKD